jgi:hypothetical protein
MLPVFNRAKAIATCEGFYELGSVARRNNNPGNLKKSGTPTDEYGHSRYESVVEGWLALYRVAYNTRDLTLMEMSRFYASDSDTWYKCVSSLTN